MEQEFRRDGEFMECRAGGYSDFRVNEPQLYLSHAETLQAQRVIKSVV
jgi:hypothetical protein